MEDLVYLSPNTKDPFTTSEVIAECTGVQHHAIQQLIRQHEKDFKEFGSLAFEMRVRKRQIGATTTKTYHLNEQQATLLMTYLRNTEVVREFKKELVRQFYDLLRSGRLRGFHVGSQWRVSASQVEKYEGGET